MSTSQEHPSHNTNTVALTNPRLCLQCREHGEGTDPTLPALVYVDASFCAFCALVMALNRRTTPRVATFCSAFSCASNSGSAPLGWGICQSRTNIGWVHTTVTGMVLFVRGCRALIHTGYIACTQSSTQPTVQVCNITHLMPSLPHLQPQPLGLFVGIACGGLLLFPLRYAFAALQAPKPST